MRCTYTVASSVKSIVYSLASHTHDETDDSHLNDDDFTERFARRDETDAARRGDVVVTSYDCRETVALRVRCMRPVDSTTTVDSRSTPFKTVFLRVQSSRRIV